MKYLANQFLKSARGFTLIELLVAIAILGVLATIGLGSFSSSQMKARDSKRKSDLGQIQRALEMYYNDNSRYPAEGDLPDGGEPWQVGETVYIKERPKDPKDPSFLYVYTVEVDRSSYILYARIENTRDACFDTGQCRNDFGVDCGTAGTCNYAVSSPNVLP